jgi:hypothetical protein
VTVAAPVQRPAGGDGPVPGDGAMAPSRPAVTEACPLCGSSLDPRQDWCLSCGAAARTRLAATPNWRAPIAAIAVAAALALGVLAAALVKLAGDSGSGAPASTTTVTSVAGASTATTAATAPAASTPGATAATPSTGAATTPTVTAQPGNAGGIASPRSSPTVTAKTGAAAIPGLTPKQRKQFEKLLKGGARAKSGR